MWETTKFTWYHLLCVTRSFILRVADPVGRILSFWRWSLCHPRGQGFIQQGAKVKASRPELRRSSDQQRPIIIRTFRKAGTSRGYLPPPHELGFLEKINKLWAKRLLLKSQQLWEPRFFPGPALHDCAPEPMDWEAYPPWLTCPKQWSEVQVLKKQVPVIVRGKPLLSCGVLSLNSKRIRQSLENNLVNMQMTTAKSLGTKKMTFKPSLKPAHVHSQEMVEKPSINKTTKM